MTQQEFDRLSVDEINRLYELYLSECKHRHIHGDLRDFLKKWIPKR